MTLKICHLISGDLWAGAEVMAFNLLGGLKTLPGIELFVIVLNRGRLSQALERLGISVYVIDESEHSFLTIIRRTASIVRRHAPQVIHAHRYKENILAYLVSIALPEGAALVSTQHGMPETYHRSPSLGQRLKSSVNYKLLASKFSRTVAVSSDIEEKLVNDYALPRDTVQLIRNGIVVPEVAVTSKPKDRFVIGSAGRFFPVKDYLFMVEVAKEVSMKCDQIRFELAGDGPMLEEIQGLIEKYGLTGQFVVRGFFDDVGPFYRELDVYLNTSLHEGIPMSVLEAMAHRLPTIAPKIGGLKEIITDGVDGYLVDARNPEYFADRCLALYENAALRRQMANAAREKIIREFSMQRMAQQYADLCRHATVHTGSKVKKFSFPPGKGLS